MYSLGDDVESMTLVGCCASEWMWKEKKKRVNARQVFQSVRLLWQRIVQCTHHPPSPRGFHRAHRFMEGKGGRGGACEEREMAYVLYGGGYVIIQGPRQEKATFSPLPRSCIWQTVRDEIDESQIRSESVSHSAMFTTRSGSRFGGSGQRTE